MGDSLHPESKGQWHVAGTSYRFSLAVVDVLIVVMAVSVSIGMTGAG